ncbi:MAG: NACHT domain-containing protein [Holophagales bacterium]|nr:NACHT domain-containing protein [Holophagales bacterium]MYC09054.1 NACHT domain-containing protein [Holophagales bacterium]
MSSKANTSGGAASGGGFSFHAHLGAIAGVHTLRGTPVQWTDGLTGAAPCAVLFETSGPGDDLALELTDRSIVEIQVKKGLRADRRFWSAFDALCEGVQGNRCTYGILIVCPNSSAPVRKGYALALQRIGEGRNDGASPEQAKLRRRLAEGGYDAEAVCARIRIQTVAALDDARDAIGAAHAELGHICVDDEQVSAAWNVLCRDALSAIGSRGRRTVRNLSLRLSASGIGIADTAKNSPAAISDGLLKWAMSRTEHFSVPGIRRQLPTDEAWLPLTAIVRDASVESVSSVEEALAAYRALGEKSRTRRETVHARTIGTFRKVCVVIGGPGSGKSLLLRVLAQEFARDSYVSIRVRLRDLATRMKETGCGVEEGLFQLGLDGTGVPRDLLRVASLPDLVLLCDGLDECEAYQDEIASGLQNIAVAHPSYRVVVTTRPIGYSTGELSDWRHYELMPLDEEHTAENLETLCRCALEDDSESMEELAPRIRSYLTEGTASRLLARSPLLLAFGAAVLLEWEDPSRSKLQHYERIFRLLERDRSLRNPGRGPPSSAVRNRVLNQLGWLTLVSPLSDAEKLRKQCAQTLQQDLSATPLQALIDVEACVDYWEDKGLIERLRHSGTELLAFIHKTFGEFAATRHLAEMEPINARRLMGDVLFKLDWGEMLDFAPQASWATPLAQLLVAEFEASDPDESVLNRLVGVLLHPGVSLSADERRSFLGTVDAVVRSEDRRKAYRVGLCLTEHDLSRVPEAGETASALLSAANEWTRLVGWAVLACHFPNRVSREALEKALRHFMQRSQAKDFFVRRASKFPFGVRPDRRLFEDFVIGALKSLLAGEDTEYQDGLIAEVWQAQRMATARFSIRLEGLIKEIGREDAPRAPWRSTGAGAVDPSGLDELKAGWVAVLTEVVAPVLLDDDSDPRPSSGLKHLAAFFEMAGISRVPAGDDSVWLSEEAQLEEVHSLLRGAALVFCLPRERLAAEARHVVARVESLRRQGKWRALLLELLPAVDAPETDWSGGRDVDIALDVLEGLVRHPSQWVQRLATFFLYAQLQGDERLRASERVLRVGAGDALHWAAALASDLPGSSTMLIRRLEGGAVAGLHHLFDHLKEQGFRVSAPHLAALENGLINCGAKTAVSAARWCEATASRADTWLVDLLRFASSYWAKNEDPYPESWGAVPDSPREALLRTQCIVAMPEFGELAALAGDPRRDVAEAAIDGIVELVASSPEEKSALVQGVLGKRFSAAQCETLLGRNVQYCAEELSMLCGLCGDPDPAYRYVAVRGVLGHPQTSRKKAVAAADAMRNDEDGNVRDAVHGLLECWGKERP